MSALQKPKFLTLSIFSFILPLTSVWGNPAADTLTRQEKVQVQDEIPDPRTERRERLLTQRKKLLEIRQRVAEVRDSSRRAGHLLVGLVGAYHATEIDSGDHIHVQIADPFGGILVGYRKHFMRGLGWQMSSQILVGKTRVDFSEDSSSRASNYYYSDYQYETHTFAENPGTTTVVNTMANLILGPMGRFTLEPGLGFTWGSNSADQVVLQFSDGPQAMPLRKHFSYYDLALGASVYLGKTDRHVLHAGLIGGRDIAKPQEWHYEFNVGYQFALDGRLTP